MAYITPKTDWNATDYFNVDPDWNRIYGNARLTSALAEIMLDTSIAFTSITQPVISKNPTEILAIVNTLLANIETLRLAMLSPIPSLTSEIKDDWIAGKENHPPDYVEANQWENTIDTIWDHWSGDSLPVCPTLSADVTIINNIQIYVDCVQLGNYSIIITGTGSVRII